MTFPGFFIDYSTLIPQQYIIQNNDSEYWILVETNKELEKKNK